VEELKSRGVELIGEPVDEEYGKFGWIMDPEGNKIELWEPSFQNKKARIFRAFVGVDGFEPPTLCL
jgi:alkyl hydroperoxide reductase subunit AhpC